MLIELTLLAAKEPLRPGDVGSYDELSDRGCQGAMI